MLQFVTFSLDLFFPIFIPDDHANLDTTTKKMTAAVIPETSIMAFKGSIKTQESGHLCARTFCVLRMFEQGKRVFILGSVEPDKNLRFG